MAKEIRARGQPVKSGVCAGRGWPGPGGWALPMRVVPALCPLGTSPVAIAEVWKAPDIAQAHGIAHARQYKLDLVAPVAPFEVLVLLGGLTGHSTILWGQEKSYHQQGIGMRCLTLQASPSRDTVDPPGPHPHAGLPLCWHELAGRPGRGAQREEWLPEGAKRGLPHQPPAPCAGGTSPPEELLPASERWDTERELELRDPSPSPAKASPVPSGYGSGSS